MLENGATIFYLLNSTEAGRPPQGAVLDSSGTTGSCFGILDSDTKPTCISCMSL